MTIKTVPLLKALQQATVAAASTLHSSLNQPVINWYDNPSRIYSNVLTRYSRSYFRHSRLFFGSSKKMKMDTELHTRWNRGTTACGWHVFFHEFSLFTVFYHIFYIFICLFTVFVRLTLIDFDNSSSCVSCSLLFISKRNCAKRSSLAARELSPIVWVSLNFIMLRPLTGLRSCFFLPGFSRFYIGFIYNSYLPWLRPLWDSRHELLCIRDEQAEERSYYKTYYLSTVSFPWMDL